MCTFLIQLYLCIVLVSGISSESTKYIWKILSALSARESRRQWHLVLEVVRYMATVCHTSIRVLLRTLFNGRICMKCIRRIIFFCFSSFFFSFVRVHLVGTFLHVYVRIWLYIHIRMRTYPSNVYMFSMCKCTQGSERRQVKRESVMREREGANGKEGESEKDSQNCVLDLQDC